MEKITLPETNNKQAQEKLTICRGPLCTHFKHLMQTRGESTVFKHDNKQLEENQHCAGPTLLSLQEHRCSHFKDLEKLVYIF